MKYPTPHLGLRVGFALSLFMGFALSSSAVSHASMHGAPPDISMVDNATASHATMHYAPPSDVSAQNTAEAAAKQLIGRFTGFTGTCPSVSCGGTLCALICCPCCVCCIAEAVAKEIFSFPSTRVQRFKQNTRTSIMEWKKTLLGLDSNHPSVLAYNDYLGTLREVHANDRHDVPLFDSDPDFAAFLIQ